MYKILLMLSMLVANTVTQAQVKDSAHLQHKNEMNEMNEANQHRMQMEKKQLQAPPEIINEKKIAGTKTTKKCNCKGSCTKKE